MFTILSILICTYFPIFDILAEILLCCTGYLEVDVSHLIFSYTSAEKEVIISDYEMKIHLHSTQACFLTRTEATCKMDFEKKEELNH